MIAEEPLVVPLEGEWDVYRVPELDQRLQPAYTAPQVILDLTSATYIDSTCLGALVRMRKARDARALGPARLVISSPMVLRIFEIVRLDRVWPIYDSVEAARG